MQETLRPAPHGNHGLFSDHYLDRTLPDRADWRLFARSEDVAGTLARLQAVYVPFTFYAESSNEAQTEEGFIKPVLRELGHTFELQASLDAPSFAKKPDYVCYDSKAAKHENSGKKLTEANLAEG